MKFDDAELFFVEGLFFSVLFLKINIKIDRLNLKI